MLFRQTAGKLPGIHSDDCHRRRRWTLTRGNLIEIVLPQGEISVSDERTLAMDTFCLLQRSKRKPVDWQITAGNHNFCALHCRLTWPVHLFGASFRTIRTGQTMNAAAPPMPPPYNPSLIKTLCERISQFETLGTLDKFEVETCYRRCLEQTPGLVLGSRACVRFVNISLKWLGIVAIDLCIAWRGTASF
jgi:hypothetical protein